MAIEVTDLVAELDATKVQQQQEELAQLMADADPTIDTRRGVLHDVLFRNEAIYAEKNTEELDRLKRSQSLLEASVDPALADEETIDNIASNYNTTRKAGGVASGEIVIIVDTLEPLTIASGTIWESNGIQFTNTVVFNAVTSNAGVTGPNDRVLDPVGDGTFEFAISVVAVSEGASGLVVKDALFVPQTIPTTFVKSFAASDFTGGTDSETNAQLISRLLEGAACKALSGSTNMNAALRDQEAFADVLATSVIGFGDAEMVRDQHSLFPGSLGGRVDWYIRSQERPQNVGLTKLATLITKNPDGSSVWQLGIGRDDAPGFFDVSSVVERGSTATTSLNITSDVRSTDLTALDNDGFLPDIEDDVEGVYSRFQTAVIQFSPTGDEVDVSAMTEGDEVEYDITLRTMPLIKDIQDWASSRGVRNRAGDALIKSPVPCFVSVSFTILLPPGQASPDTGLIANDVAELVNRFGFTGQLPASSIADVVHNSLTGAAHTGAIDLLGDLRFPDGELRRIRTTEILMVPDEPQRMVSSRTVGFLTTPEDVAISVETADIPEI